LAKDSFGSQRYVPLVLGWPLDWVSFEVSWAFPFCVTRIYAEFFDDSVFCWIFAPSREFLIRIVLELLSFGLAAPSRYSRQGFGPSNCLFSGQQRLQDIRGRASVPRITLFRASSAFKIFEAGLRSLELLSFGPAAPSRYLRQGFGLSNCLFLGQQRLQDIQGRASVPRITLFRASSAFKIFEAGLQSLELLSFGPAAPSRYSRQGFGPSNYSLLGQQRLQDIRGRASVP
jgi:hypothetical protein